MPAPSVQSATASLADRQAFDEHARRLQTVVTRSVRTSPANIEDACGFAWLQFVRHRPTRAVAFAWLCTTVVREAIKLDRQMRRTVGLDHAIEVPADPVVGPDGRLELIVGAQRIQTARLTPRQARVLGLRAAGYSRQEIAELIGDSSRTLDRQLGRARRKLGQARGAEAT